MDRRNDSNWRVEDAEEIEYLRRDEEGKEDNAMRNLSTWFLRKPLSALSMPCSTYFS